VALERLTVLISRW